VVSTDESRGFLRLDFTHVYFFNFQ